MKNIQIIIDSIYKDHEKMESGDISKNHGAVRSRNYNTIVKAFADKLKHDKHYGINDPIQFYGK